MNSQETKQAAIKLGTWIKEHVIETLAILVIVIVVVVGMIIS